MFLITIAILICILWLVTRRDKSLINPVTTSCGLWLFLLVVYETTGHELYPLSNEFYYVLLLWICPFSITYFVLSAISVNKRVRFEYAPSKFIFNSGFLLFFIIMMLAYDLFKFNEIRSYGIDGLFHYMREINVDKSNGVVEVSPVEVNISRIIQFSYVLLLIYILRKFKFKYKSLFIILFAVQLLFGANKFVIARFLFGYLAIKMATGKLGLKKLVLILGVVMLFFGIFNMMRKVNPDNYDPLVSLQVYLLAPLPAFDTYMLNSHSEALFTTTSFGEHVFASLRGTAMLNPEFFENDNMVFVPLPVNVFTMMSSYFVDFRHEGVFWASLFWGLLFSYIYLRSRKSEVHLILYAALFHILALQFFADYLITSHARMHLVLMIALFFIIYHPKIKLEKK